MRRQGEQQSGGSRSGAGRWERVREASVRPPPPQAAGGSTVRRADLTAAPTPGQPAPRRCEVHARYTFSEPGPSQASGLPGLPSGSGAVESPVHPEPRCPNAVCSGQDTCSEAQASLAQLPQEGAEQLKVEIPLPRAVPLWVHPLPATVLPSGGLKTRGDAGGPAVPALLVCVLVGRQRGGVYSPWLTRPWWPGPVNCPGARCFVRTPVPESGFKVK